MKIAAFLIGLIIIPGIYFLSQEDPAIGQSMGTLWFPSAGDLPEFVLDVSDGCAEWSSNVLTTTGSACGSGGGTPNWVMNAAADALTPSTTVGVVINASSTFANSLNVVGTSTLATTSIVYWISDAGNLGLDLNDDGSDLALHANVGGTNKLTIKTDGAFLDLVANPGPSNDYLMFSINETQGADTQINFYEGGTGNNRFWDSGSARFGGPAGSQCSNLSTLVDCDTAGTGADIVVQDDIAFGGSLVSTSTESSYLSGNLGIGTTTPGSKLDVNGTVRFESLTGGLLTAAANGVLSIDSSTYLTGITGESIFSLSDVTQVSSASGSVLVYDGSGFNSLATSSLGITGGSGATTDGGAVTYVTGTSDDFAIGGTDSTAAFFFDTGLKEASTTNLYIAGNATTAGSHYFADGSAAAPSIAWADNKNTGLYSTAVSEIAFTNGGTNTWKIKSNGTIESTLGGSGLFYGGAAGYGSESGPTYSFLNDTDTGIWQTSVDTMGIGAGSVEFLTLVESTADELVFNEDGDDIDARFESDTVDYALFFQGSDGYFGIATATPTSLLTVGSSTPGHITENYRATFLSGQLEVDGSAWFDGGATTTTMHASNSYTAGAQHGFITGTTTKSVRIASSTLGDNGTKFSAATTTYTIESYVTEPFLLPYIGCVATTTGSVSVQLGHGNGTWTNAGSCGAQGRITLTTNNTWAKGEQVQVRIGSSASSPSFVVVTTPRRKTGI